MHPGPGRPSAQALRRAGLRAGPWAHAWPWHEPQDPGVVLKTTGPCSPMLWPLPFFVAGDETV